MLFVWYRHFWHNFGEIVWLLSSPRCCCCCFDAHAVQSFVKAQQASFFAQTLQHNQVQHHAARAQQERTFLLRRPAELQKLLSPVQRESVRQAAPAKSQRRSGASVRNRAESCCHCLHCLHCLRGHRMISSGEHGSGIVWPSAVLSHFQGDDVQCGIDLCIPHSACHNNGLCGCLDGSDCGRMLTIPSCSIPGPARERHFLAESPSHCALWAFQCNSYYHE